ncbi:transporter substrate-binding domain-containing protein [Curvibacter sp. APW13]|uniref:substrate-binding periplasmic protein n=1 Tax=Curvibacter sp. APW13 TaxID=3077236 RepID=UPI0028DDAE1F|nr:transporter substrate-binding domain-containing protein [Curvibacter sp. APW13]MDT8991605.1 transporter substrate-binding domain-containing protein [Curvibacter sp. APW13]
MKFLFRSVIVCALMVLVQARADTLRIGTGNFPPYFDERGTAGLFNDIIRGVFALMPQHQLVLVPQMSNYRLAHSLNDGTMDGAANIFSASDIKGCRTDGVFRFTDVAVTRKDRQLTVASVADLAGKRVVTYQGAKTFLGPSFAQAVGTGDDKLYRELAQPLMQARALAQGEADVSVGDLYIFLHSIKILGNPAVRADQFAIHPLFPDTYSHMAFREQKWCDEFNAALGKFRKSGRYEALYAQTLKALKP